MTSPLDRLRNLTAQISSYELSRKENLKELERLYDELGIAQKVPEFAMLFDYKAINLSGLSLQGETLGQIREGRYVQIIAITYDKSADVKNKNSSLAYFGRSEKLENGLKQQIIAFVLRWRFEKSFRTLEHYHGLIALMKVPDA